MGLSFASKRHTNVVVMAPALTETSQTQNFKFVTSPSRSPSLSLKNHIKKSPEVQPKLSNGFDYSTGMNGHSPVNKTTLSINGIAKNLRNEFLPLEKRYSGADEKDKLDANYSITQIGGYIMNSGFVGDPDMGLQKSNNDLIEGEKCSPEVEMLQKNLAGIISDEINSNPVLNQNVEEILKAMSSNLDSTASETEIEPVPSAEHIFPDMSTALNGTELGSFERGLFNEVDIMNMCVDESLVAVNKETLVRDRIEELRKRNFQVARKIDYLLRRLRKIEARVVGKFAAEEIASVIEYSYSLTEASSRVRTFSGSGSDSTLQSDNKPLSLFMRQLEQAVVQQSKTISFNPSRQCKYFGSGSYTNTLVSTSNGVRATLPGSVLPPYSPSARESLDFSSGELSAQMAKIQQSIDSEATDSSSGCESSDEFVNYNNSHQHQLTISKRALWKWSEERAAIASKWTWLQSQLWDLDIRLKQANEQKRIVIADKGSLKFEGETSSPVLQRFDENSCSRTRGLIRSSFRKRKLYQIHGLHRTSKRARMLPTFPCTCTSSIPGCGCCTGRLNRGQPVEPLECMPIPSRVSVIDPGFHPVLSFPDNVSASLHYDAVMKCAEWQSKACRIQGKSSTLSSTPQSIPPPSAEEKPKGGRLPTNDGQVVDLQRSKAAALAVSFKLRRKIARGKRRRRNNLTLERYRRRKTSTGVSAGDSEELTEQDIETTNGGRYPSPVPSPASTSTSTQQTPNVSKDKDTTLKRKRENSYDIDNIVIPYSIASSARLEKLAYKEILTPKWRLVPSPEAEPKNGMRRSSHEIMEMEDDSEEAVIARHERCQIDEKKRFLSYLKLPGAMGRGRAQRRTDSRADSSGPNTPDGMSPRDDGPVSTDEPPLVNSPPPQPQPSPQPQPAPSEIETGRRRTISFNSQPQLVYCEVEPYERRVFPISEDALRDDDDDVVENGDIPADPPNNAAYESPTGPASPGSISTDSADSSFIGEDPNDPEWTSADRANKANSKR